MKKPPVHLCPLPFRENGVLIPHNINSSKQFKKHLFGTFPNESTFHGLTWAFQIDLKISWEHISQIKPMAAVVCQLPCVLGLEHPCWARSWRLAFYAPPWTYLWPCSQVEALETSKIKQRQAVNVHTRWRNKVPNSQCKEFWNIKLLDTDIDSYFLGNALGAKNPNITASLLGIWLCKVVQVHRSQQPKHEEAPDWFLIPRKRWRWYTFPISVFQTSSSGWKYGILVEVPGKPRAESILIWSFFCSLGRPKQCLRSNDFMSLCFWIMWVIYIMF